MEPMPGGGPSSREARALVREVSSIWWIVLIVGVLTNQCIAATSKDAMFRDFKPIVVEECTGTTLPHLHGPAIEMISVGWGQVNTLEETLRELSAFPAVMAAA